MENKLNIVTDCDVFQKKLKQIAHKVASQALLIKEYNYQKQHSVATRNKHVDALSRKVPIKQSVLILNRSNL